MEDQRRDINRICYVLLALMFSLCMYYYPILPDTIPTHFNAKMEADGWGPKIMIWMLPVIGLLTFLIVDWSINFSLKADASTLRKWQTGYRGKSDNFIKKNVVKVAKHTSHLNLIVVLLFFSLFAYSISAALGKPFSHWSWVTWGLTAAIFIPIFNMVRDQYFSEDE